MENFTKLLVILLLLVASTASAGARQEAVSVGAIVSDVTASSGCQIIDRVYAAGFESEVVSETLLPCPAGSVIATTYVASADEAPIDGIFVPLSGDPASDLAAVENTSAALRPSYESSSPATEAQAALACTETSYSRSFNYTAYDPGVQVFTTVYYSSDFYCSFYFSSIQTALSWNADVFWEKGGYASTHNWNHGCPNLGISYTWQGLSGYRPFNPGYWVYDAVNNRYNACKYYGIPGGTTYEFGTYL